MTMSDNPYDSKWDQQQIKTMDYRYDLVDWIKTLGLSADVQSCLISRFDKVFDMSHTLGYYMGRKFSHDIKSLSDNSE